MEAVEVELQRRRERGRSAQAAFRRRQARAAQEVKDQNKRLQEALESIVGVARVDDRAELLLVIKSAAQAAGIDTQHLGTRDEENIDSAGLSPSRSSQSTESAQSAEPAQVRVIVAHDPPPSASSFGDTFPFPAYYGSFDPLHYLRINIPPADIIPYLDSGRYTLAGQIFWAILEHTTQCQHMHHPRVPSDYTKLHPSLARIFGHSESLRKFQPAYFLAMAEARLEYLRRGSISDGYAAAAERDSADVLSKMVRREYKLRGEDTSPWLSSLEVEWRLRAVLGDGVVQAMEKVLKGPTTVAPYVAVRRLVDKMTDNFVCFGDGPRLGREFVDEVIDGWVEKVSECALQKDCFSIGVAH